MAPSHAQWIIPFAVQIIPAGLLMIGCFLIKESPRWLFQSGQREKAIKNLCWLRNLPADHIYMQEEISAIDYAIEHQATTVGLGFWQPFKAVFTNRRVMYRFLLGGSLFMFQNGTVSLPSSSISYMTFTHCPTGYQRHQLLFPNRLPLHRHHRHQHLPPDHRRLRRRQDRHHPRLALLSHRPLRPPRSAHVRRRCRQSVHVVHRRLHCRVRPTQ